MKVIKLINCKFRTLNKYNQVIKNILSRRLYSQFKEKILFELIVIMIFIIIG
jgi:hypothetical protein